MHTTKDGLPRCDGWFWWNGGGGWILTDIRNEGGRRSVFRQGTSELVANPAAGQWFSTTASINSDIEEQKTYDVAISIHGKYALFTNPESCGTAPQSYKVPTWSACKGILESIGGTYWRAGIFAYPTEVRIMSPIVFQSDKQNYGGPFRKARHIATGSSHQFTLNRLYRPTYIISARLLRLPSVFVWGVKNEIHKAHDIIKRRASAGQYTIGTPCLGTTDCLAEDWTWVDPSFVADIKPEDINLVLPHLLFSPFDRPVNGRIAIDKPYMRNVKVSGGVLRYAWSFDPMP